GHARTLVFRRRVVAYESAGTRSQEHRGTIKSGDIRLVWRGGSVMRGASIVEGHGEVQALPVLWRRFNTWQPGETYVDPLPPIRVSRDRFLNKEDDFRGKLLLAAAKSGPDGWVLVVLDADDDCPAE